MLWGFTRLGFKGSGLGVQGSGFQGFRAEGIRVPALGLKGCGLRVQGALMRGRPPWRGPLLGGPQEENPSDYRSRRTLRGSWDFVIRVPFKGSIRVLQGGGLGYEES